MPRKPAPFYWKARQAWYCTIGGKRHPLGTVKSEAETLFHKLMGAPEETLPGNAVAVILDDFQTWANENLAPRTAARYADFLQSFIKCKGLIRVTDLTTADVTDWLKTEEGWNSTTKRNAITAIQRGFNWATKNRGLKINPVRGMEKPRAKTRTTVVAAESFDEILAHVNDQHFHDLLIVSYDCGCRPQELKQLEGRHVEIDKRRAVLPGDEAKGKLARAIYFPTDRSVEIIQRLMSNGILFKNTKGRPWTAFAVKCRFEDIQVKIGREEMAKRGIESTVTDEVINKFSTTLPKSKIERATGKSVPKKPWELRREARIKLVTAEAVQYARRFRHYDLRHTFVTRKLVAGVDSHVVAALAGHKDTKMIDTVYSHIAADHSFMLANAQKGEKPPASMPKARKSK